MERPLTEAAWHRINPLTLVIEAGKALRQLAFVGVIFVINVMRNDSNEGIGIELVLAILGFAVVFVALIKYYTFRFAIHEDRLLIRSGVLYKNLRTIPLERIQNINYTRSLLHRALGLVDLQIETASGGAAEGSISALSESQAELLKTDLLRASDRLNKGEEPSAVVGMEAPPARPQSRLIYKATSRELFLVGASENRMLAFVGLLAGLPFVYMGFQDFFEPENIEGFMSGMSVDWPVWIMVGVAMLLFGWVASIISAFTRYFNFTLSAEGSQIRRQFGLFNHIENVVPIRRIQSMSTAQTWIQRLLKIRKVYVSTAGAMTTNDQQQGQSSSPLLTPVLNDDALPAVLKLVFPDRELGDPDYKPVGQATIIRHTRSSLIPGVLIAAATAYWIEWWSLAIVGVFVLGGIWYGWVHARYAKWAIASNTLVSRLGLLTRRIQYSPCDKVQSVEVIQSPLQRRLKLCTVETHSAGLMGGNVLEDVTVTDGAFLAADLHRRSAEGRDSLVDGM